MDSGKPPPRTRSATSTRGTEDASSPRSRQDRAAATREEIVRTARAAFVESGYDGVSLRHIARSVGVDPRLVSHYFASKAELFAAALELTTETAPMVPPVTDDAAAVLLTGSRGATTLDGYYMTIRSTSNPEAVAIIRDVVRRHGELPLADRLPGDQRPGRAALLIAVNMGVLLMRDILGAEALTSGDTEELIPYLDAALAALAGSDGSETSPA
ncbi:TetR family transcriptional regulator [Streptomyces sp. NPDC001761]